MSYRIFSHQLEREPRAHSFLGRKKMWGSGAHEWTTLVAQPCIERCGESRPRGKQGSKLPRTYILISACSKNWRKTTVRGRSIWIWWRSTRSSEPKMSLSSFSTRCVYSIRLRPREIILRSAFRGMYPYDENRIIILWDHIERRSVAFFIKPWEVSSRLAEEMMGSPSISAA